MKLLKNVHTLAIGCSQWGDTGKGKFVHRFADWAHIIARGTGGANAGHTIEYDGKKIIVHMVPSGIVCPEKINVIGSGVVIDPRQLVDELSKLRKNGIDYQGRLLIAHNAKLILPQHLVIDRMRNSGVGNEKIGTTGRGIGPAYAHFYDRIGLFVNDLQNPDYFARRLEENLKESGALIKGYDRPEVFHKIMQGLDNGKFYSQSKMFDRDAIIETYTSAGKEISEMIADTDSFMHQTVGRKRILLEGAQGLLLSIKEGTYPFVTSSGCSDQYMAQGAGLHPRDIDLTLAIVKAFYMTRVGEGPFPTEMGGDQSDRWCSLTAPKQAQVQGFNSVRDYEASQRESFGLDSSDEFMVGIAMRIAGDEYGATTGRPRRTGWLDLPLLRYAREVTGNTNIILTKLDVLDFCPEIKICIGYKYAGPPYIVGRQKLVAGDMLKVAIPNADVLKYCQPIYRQFPGWLRDITGAKKEKDLPKKLLNIVRFVERETGTRALILSVGPDRDQTIERI